MIVIKTQDRRQIDSLIRFFIKNNILYTKNKFNIILNKKVFETNIISLSKYKKLTSLTFYTTTTNIVYSDILNIAKIIDKTYLNNTYFYLDLSYYKQNTLIESLSSNLRKYNLYTKRTGSILIISLFRYSNLTSKQQKQVSNYLDKLIKQQLIKINIFDFSKETTKNKLFYSVLDKNNKEITTKNNKKQQNNKILTQFKRIERVKIKRNLINPKKNPFI